MSDSAKQRAIQANLKTDDGRTQYANAIFELAEIYGSRSLANILTGVAINREGADEVEGRFVTFTARGPFQGFGDTIGTFGVVPNSEEESPA